MTHNQTAYMSYESTLSDWHNRIKKAQTGHYARSESLYRTANITGWLLIISTVFVTAMSFFSYGKDLHGVSSINLGLFEINAANIQYLVILVGIVSAFLSGVVSQSRFAERAEQHRSAAGRYGNIRRSVEYLLAKIQQGSITENASIEVEMDKIKLEWDYISNDAPLTTRKTIEEAEKNTIEFTTSDVSN
ncbi:SLATT domain-containing protein [Vibrio jasicida]|uniref:SLATT domain-containing protein n=1 Tax=Vibrio jasicida TaxID=766224 RepID=UPI000CE2D5D7|nr:SLATT domain-containing protein [Vibrio jasicida]